MCPHQDGAFLYTEPQSCIGFWWPLDDCSEENGCLYAVPGSHVLGVQRRFRRRDPPDNGSTGIILSDDLTHHFRGYVCDRVRSGGVAELDGAAQGCGAAPYQPW